MEVINIFQVLKISVGEEEMGKYETWKHKIRKELEKH